MALQDIAAALAAQGIAPGPAPSPGKLDAPLRPSALVRLVIRLEDFSNDDGDDAVSEGKPFPDPTSLDRARRAKSDRATAAARAAGRHDLQAEAQARRAAAGTRGLGGGSVDTGGAAPENVARDEYSIVLVLVTPNWDLDLKTFQEADKFTAAFPHRDLPILPEMLRSVLVEVFLGAAPVEGFGDPRRWAPDTTRHHLVFRGYASEVDLSEDSANAQVQITAYSLQQVLMDKQINPLSTARRVRGHGERVTAYLRRFFSTIPEFSGALGGDPIGVRIYPDASEEADRVLDAKLFLRTLQSAQSRAQAAGGSVAADTQPPGQDPASALGGGSPQVPGPNVGSKIRAWDVVVRAALMVGLVPHYDPSVDPNAILLMPPQNLFETPAGSVQVQGAAREDPPFQRRAGDGSMTNVRVFAWGKNIKALKFERKFGRNKPKGVQVVSYNPDARGKAKLVFAKFPEKVVGGAASAVGTERAKNFGKGHRAVEEIVTVTVQGLRDVEQAKQVAVALYHSLTKRELRVSLETDDLTSFIDPRYPEDPNAARDLLRLRPGTPVRVTVALGQGDPSKGLVVNTLSEILARRFDRGFLRKLLMEQRARAGQLNSSDDERALDDALTKIEAAYSSAKLTDVFFVKAVNHKFSADEGGGYTCRIELFNYVEARNIPRDAGDVRANDKAKRVKPGHSPVPADAALDANVDAIRRRALIGGSK